MLQAGVIVSDYATLIVEILKDNARPEAGEVYGAMDMGWASSSVRLPRHTENDQLSNQPLDWCAKAEDRRPVPVATCFPFAALLSSLRDNRHPSKRDDNESRAIPFA
jgi:hypothetical protein